jgi:hypothetical protein
MRLLYQAFYVALLALALVGASPALARGTHWDPACHCRRPDAQYTTHRYVRAPARIITHRRVVTRQRVVKRTRLVQENRVVVHVRPVINRVIIVHKTNTIVRNIWLHRVRTINRYRNVYYTQVIHRYAPGWTRYVNEVRAVPSASCDCGYGRGLFRSGELISYGD